MPSHAEADRSGDRVCRDEIRNPGCKARVQKIMEYAASDIRFDVPLADACYEDRQDFCAGVPPGSARVIRCLQDRCGSRHCFLIRHSQAANRSVCPSVGSKTSQC